MAGKAEAQRQIDDALRHAVEAGEVPGVVAIAADATGPIYEGAFGVRALGGGAPMTLDTVFRVASMTKAVTSVAAMQLVEEGRLSLDAPVPDIGAPAISAPQVLDGFDAAGKPLLRLAKRPITLKHLLTHTAGFTYEFWNPDTARYVEAADAALMSGRRTALDRALMFDPGERWEYGINIDWVGRVVEALSGRDLDTHLRERIFAPLGMHDTGFAPTPEQRARLALVHQRQADSSLVPQPLPPARTPEYFAGGGGLYSTAPDYLKFLRMLLGGGILAGARVLQPETVALMHENHIGELPAGALKTCAPELTNDVDFFPGASVRWGLGHMLNLDPGPNGRSAGTVGWAGIHNTYYWLDPARRVAGAIMTQILPFADPAVVQLYGRFERGVYDLTGAA